MRERLRRGAPTAIAYVLVAAIMVVGLSRFTPVAVAGGSMRPALWPGDLVVVWKSAGVRRGDIVLAVSPGHGPVLHRVVDSAPDGGFHLRGDANPTADLSATAASCIRGRVVLVVPFGAALSRWRGDEDSATLSAQSNSAKR